MKKKQKEYQVGDKVLGHWSEDGFWYLGKIINKIEEKYYVKFFKGDKEWRIKDQLYPMKNLKVGEQVLYRIKATKYAYKGRIKKIQEDKIIILPEEARKEETVGLEDVCFKRN